MRIPSKIFASIAAFACWNCLFVHLIMAQRRPAPSELVQKLQSEKTTDEARKQLLQVGNSDPEVRRYLAAQLPPLIQRGPKSCPPSEIVDLTARWHSCPWYNAVELAGNLKISEASSALAPWIGWRSGGPFLPTLEARLVFHPAAKALAEIGDPAIPVVQQALSNPKDHYPAVRILCIIHTAKAKAALQEDLPHETNPAVQTMIKNSL
jgi:hypothetical protein